MMRQTFVSWFCVRIASDGDRSVAQTLVCDFRYRDHRLKSVPQNPVATARGSDAKTPRIGYRGVQGAISELTNFLRNPVQLSSEPVEVGIKSHKPGAAL